MHHGSRERAGFRRRHATKEDGHGEGAGLIVGDFAGGVAADELGDFVGVEFRAVAFAFDESGDVHAEMTNDGMTNDEPEAMTQRGLPRKLSPTGQGSS